MKKRTSYNLDRILLNQKVKISEDLLKVKRVKFKKDVLRDAFNHIGSFLSYRNYENLNAEALKKQFGTLQADVLLVLGNSIPYTAELAAKLYKNGICKKIMFSGGVGHSTPILRENAKQKYPFLNVENKSEAFILAEIAKQQENILTEDILLEEKSSNTGENALFSLNLLQNQNISHNSLILIQDPLLQLRSFATLQHYFSNSKINILSFSPFIPYLNEQFNFASQSEICGMWSLKRFIELIIGEIPRLRDDRYGYGPCGKHYMIHIDIPPRIEEEYSLILKSFPDSRKRRLI
ncbi:MULTISPECIES: YdcF family protein [unclassified Sporolactobacillus]|uniref:YdcF family protein n=1 Tax=unclassified Sporolactobacillus TaxID=2628533 RepID=UPI002368BC34|nr:YdcF family protein [Sporolactobacillus sp. CQH2019]MDD9150167.1 YdcF family protein [Sporolactobacillus sp. CQH2019]